MINRLVFFGDSWTYGHGLSDCNGVITPAPSLLGWAPTVSRILNYNYVNLASPGNSNQGIFFDIRRAQLTNEDLIIVQWSYTFRDMLINNDGTVRHIRPKDIDSVAYYDIHSDADILRRNVLTIEHTALWLNNQGLKWIFFQIIIYLGVNGL